MARRDVQRGQFIIANGGRAEISDRRDRIQKGAFLISTPRSSTRNLQREFPEMAGAIEAAGRLPTAADLARHWQQQAELEQRLADLKVRIKAVKRK